MSPPAKSPPDPLLAIGVADGRYRDKLAALAPIVSEFGLQRFRVQVECYWFAQLAACPEIQELPALSNSQLTAVHNIHQGFSLLDANSIKTFEATTNHDVKAVEYFVKGKISQIPGLESHLEFVHFACTSEDINNTAYALMLKHLRDDVLLTQMNALITALETRAEDYADDAMLSRTHGQAASPSTMGKELRNFSTRLVRQQQQFEQLAILGKMNGAVGNFNAHLSAYPNVDWSQLSDGFLHSLGLTPNHHTTQIEPHDYIAELFHCLIRFNQILLDFNRDMWSYIAIEYFRQNKVEGETGSSTMPHKINPIDFENSEGNLGIANTLLEHMAAKLQVSRWQRDLSDSTVLRNIGTVSAHCVIAYQATLKGLSRVELARDKLTEDLANSWEVLGEAVQTVMRRYGMKEPYEQLKAATRGERLDAVLFQQILTTLELPEAARKSLEDLTPAAYIGLAATLARTKD